MALKSDLLYQDGDYATDRPPVNGLAAARAIAMISYRSPESLNERFSRKRISEVRDTAEHESDDFAIRSWLRFHGDALVTRFDAHSYRVLIDAMDTHDISRHRGNYVDVLRQMTLPVLIGSINSDALYVPNDQLELLRHLPNAELLAIDSSHGHDGFLIDAAGFAGAIDKFLRKIVSSIN